LKAGQGGAAPEQSRRDVPASRSLGLTTPDEARKQSDDKITLNLKYIKSAFSPPLTRPNQLAGRRHLPGCQNTADRNYPDSTRDK